jgi:prepilin-type N-terminal cleavage/methylation domain-containing protein
MRAGIDRSPKGIRADQRGFTLPELLVATLIALIVTSAGLYVLEGAVRSQPRISQRAAKVQQGRTLVERITRELRQGESVTNASASGFKVLTYIDQVTCGGQPSTSANFCQVTYACTSTACTRTLRNPNGTGTAAPQTVASGITGPNVFTYQPSSVNPSYLGVKLVYPASGGEDAVTLDDGVALRNYLAAD